MGEVDDGMALASEEAEGEREDRDGRAGLEEEVG